MRDVHFAFLFPKDFENKKRGISPRVHSGSAQLEVVFELLFIESSTRCYF